MTSKKTSHNGARSSGRASAQRAGRTASVSRTPQKPATRKRASSSRPAAPQRKIPRPNRARPYFVPLTIAAILVVAAWSYYPVARLQYQEQRERSRLEVELEGLRERNGLLREQVDRLKTPEGVEEIARESLGLVMEGENLYVVLDGTETPTAAAVGPATPQVDLPEPGLGQRILDMLFGFEG